MTDSCATLQQRGGWWEDRVLKRCSGPIGPRNAWSNAGYALAGLLAVRLRPDHPGAVLFAMAMVALGYGSWRYHAQKTVRANLLDRVGMFLVLVQLAALAITPALPAVVILTLLGTVFAVYKAPLRFMDAQIGVWLAIAAVGGYLRGDPWLTTASLLCFVAGYACWHLDRAEDHPLGLWGHALWHLFTAPAFLLMWLALAGPR